MTDAASRTVDGTSSVSFTVRGIPAPKGNLSAFPIRRANGRMGAVMVEGKGNNRHPYAPWKLELETAWMELRAMGIQQLTGPLVAAVHFYMPKPKKPRWPVPAVKPDLSKLLRGLEDPLNGLLIEDDARIVGYEYAWKHYAEEEGQERAEVRLWTLDAWLEEHGGISFEEVGP